MIFATYETDVSLGFQAFLKNEEKDKLKSWVTKGIKKSMSVRDKIYKQMMKKKDQLIKTKKHPKKSKILK